MLDFVTLTCPSCGGQLQVANDIDKFACGYCGTEHLVRRSGGIVSLAPVVEGIKKVQLGVDRTASELAIVRLEKEIDRIEQKIDDINSKWDDVDELETAGGIGFMAGLAAAIITTEFGPGVVVGLVVFVLTLVVYFVLEQQDKEQIGPLKKQIAQKKQELIKHQSIVSG